MVELWEKYASFNYKMQMKGSVDMHSVHPDKILWEMYLDAPVGCAATVVKKYKKKIFRVMQVDLAENSTL